MDGERFGGALQSGLMGGITGGVFGGLTGGLIGGAQALQHGRNFWTGKYSNRGLIQSAANRAEQAISGTGRFAGTEKHRYAEELLDRYQIINHVENERLIEVNKFFSDKELKIRGFLDVYDGKNKMIYDFKFGYPGKSPMDFYYTPQMIKYRDAFPGFDTWVIKPKF